MAISNSPTRYVGPSPTGGYYYANPTTGDINELSTPPTPEQQNAWQAENPKVGTTQQTQAPLQPDTSLGGTPPVYTSSQVNKDLSASAAGIKAPLQPGAAAPNDDASINNTRSGTATIINASTDPSNPIVPQGNILDQYASYTYNLAWYLLTPTQYAAMSNSPNMDVNSWSLLAQSGGASYEQQSASQSTQANQGLTTLATPGRNKYFTLDYYLDDLEIMTALGTPAQTGEISFKVTEPNGITLLPNLTAAVKDLYKDIEAAPNNANYCIVIKFYGWDDKGNLIASADQKAGTPGLTPNNTNAVATKYYPFTIAEFQFKAANKAVEYHIKGAPSHYSYGFSSGAGSVPYNLQLTGETLGAVLAGTSQVSKNNSSGGGREAGSTSAPASKTGPATLTNQEKAASQLATIKNFIFNPFGSTNSQSNNGWGEG